MWEIVSLNHNGTSPENGWIVFMDLIDDML
jgi:hypothetical protein